MSVYSSSQGYTNGHHRSQSQNYTQHRKSQSQHHRHHSRHNSIYDQILPQERAASPAMGFHMPMMNSNNPPFIMPPTPSSSTASSDLQLSIPSTPKPPTVYSSFDKELYLYLTNPANSGDYEAAYNELLQEVSESPIPRYFAVTGDKTFPATKLTCGATGEEFIEWRDAFLAILGPLAQAMIRMSGEDEEAQDDQLELIDKVLADDERPEYGAYLKQQGTYKYVCLVRDYNAKILQLISDNVSNALHNLFCSTRSAAVAYNFIKTRFNAKIWTKAIYSMATIPTPPSRHLEQFTILKDGILSAREVQACEVPAMEFSFLMEFLRSRRDIRDHPQVSDVYQRNLAAYKNKQSLLRKDIDWLLTEVENAVREVANEELLLASSAASMIGSPLSPTFPATSFEVLTKKVRTRGRKRRSVLTTNNGNQGPNQRGNDKVDNGKEN